MKTENMEKCPYTNLCKKTIKIEDGERISVTVKNKKGIEEEVMGFFTKGTLTLSWDFMNEYENFKKQQERLKKLYSENLRNKDIKPPITDVI